MNFGKCKLCGKSISYESIRICNKCYDKELKIVKEYIEENGKNTLEKISKEANVPMRVVEQFYEDGVLYEDDEKVAIIRDLKEKQRKLKNQALLNDLKDMYRKDDSTNNTSSGGMHHFNRS